MTNRSRLPYPHPMPTPTDIFVALVDLTLLSSGVALVWKRRQVGDWYHDWSYKRQPITRRGARIWSLVFGIYLFAVGLLLGLIIVTKVVLPLLP